MFSFNKYGKILLWGVVALTVLFVTGNLYSLYFKPTYATGPGNNGNVMAFLLFGLILGGALAYLVTQLNKKAKKEIKESSHTVIESIRKVFKVVCAEGQFSELYNYEETKKIFHFIPSTKKALVIIKAKVLVGYDFEKLQWEMDELSRKLKIVNFPEPEILSIEPDYKYYNMEENIFNLFSRDDLSKIQQNGKKQVEQAAIGSDLPRIAAEQMRTILTEVLQTHKWNLEDSYKITSPAQKMEEKE